MKSIKLMKEAQKKTSSLGSLFSFGCLSASSSLSEPNKVRNDEGQTDAMMNDDIKEHESQTELKAFLIDIYQTFAIKAENYVMKQKRCLNDTTKWNLQRYTLLSLRNMNINLESRMQKLLLYKIRFDIASHLQPSVIEQL